MTRYLISGYTIINFLTKALLRCRRLVVPPNKQQKQQEDHLNFIIIDYFLAIFKSTPCIIVLQRLLIIVGGQ